MSEKASWLPARFCLTVALVAACGAFLLVVGGCSASKRGGPPAAASLREALTFHASFDGGIDADFALGDPRLYHAPSWRQRGEGVAGLRADHLVRHAPGQGRFGDGLAFAVGQNPLIHYFEADRNVSYRERDWSGTISFWLKLDPDRDLAPGYSDPLQLSSKSWNDAALFVDFTKDDVPRHFRFAAFADRDVWDPSQRSWDDVPPAERPMVALTQPPFSRERWTHVVMTFERFNTGRADGIVRGYLDGELKGTLSGRQQTFTWKIEDAVASLGMNYVGGFDELSFFDRALTPAEVRALHQLEGGVKSLL